MRTNAYTGFKCSETCLTLSKHLISAALFVAVLVVINMISPRREHLLLKLENREESVVQDGMILTPWKSVPVLRLLKAASWCYLSLPSKEDTKQK